MNNARARSPVFMANRVLGGKKDWITAHGGSEFKSTTDEVSDVDYLPISFMYRIGRRLNAGNIGNMASLLQADCSR